MSDIRVYVDGNRVFDFSVEEFSAEFGEVKSLEELAEICAAKYEIAGRQFGWKANGEVVKSGRMPKKVKEPLVLELIEVSDAADVDATAADATTADATTADATTTTQPPPAGVEVPDDLLDGEIPAIYDFVRGGPEGTDVVDGWEDRAQAVIDAEKARPEPRTELITTLEDEITAPPAKGDTTRGR